MTETDRIVDQMERAFSGDAWYGMPVMEALRGVGAAQAAARPIPAAHTIWEIVLHVTAWTREVTRRLRTGEVDDPEDGDWPPPPHPADEAAWAAAMAALERAHAELVAEARRLPPERLDEPPGGPARDLPLGSGVSYYVLLHGAVQHTLAHTGQITLLRKAFAP